MPLTFLSHKGLKGLDPGQMLGEPSAEEFSARRSPGLQLRGIDTADGGTRLGRNSGHSSGIRNKLK